VICNAARSIRAEGAVVLEDIINPTLIGEARDAFLHRYARYLDGKADADAVNVGGRRLMITVDLEPPFTQRELLANPWLCSVLTAAFEGDFVLDAFGVVCSLPGAPRQHVHQDGGDLFPQAQLNRLLPITAVTAAIPLIEMNEMHGTTALWLGSHRDEACGTAATGDEPIVQEGSCMLWDYRLRHCGTSNLSAVARPLIYLTYCRPWFTDHKNYIAQASLRARKGSLAGLPEELRSLLLRVHEL
jgi:ectoine hydroxylase-related dioxygenase (phytanoyl-CoA dioxygenase family)